MHPKIQEVCDLLDDLSNSVLKSSTEDRFASDISNWQFPTANRHGFASIPKNLSENLKKISLTKIDEEQEEDLDEVCKMIKQFKSRTFPNFGYGSVEVYNAFIVTMDVIKSILEPLWSWEYLTNTNALPRSLANRLRGIESALNSIAPQKEELEQWIKLIIDGKDAAISLPTDLELLKESRNKVEKFTTESAGNVAKIEDFLIKSVVTYKSLVVNEQESKKIIAQCNEAYRVTTSVGLAAAFDERARKSNTAKLVWVAGLIVALAIGACIGSYRIKSLSEFINVPNPVWSVISMHIVLSILSIGAPLWFAWLSTKQISQSFKLSEDYAFKASVAKAYEGYRREAARIDPVFEARLFSSVLTRLDEAPLRLVDSDIHGSPWHELLASPAFQKALDIVPELKKEFVEIAKKGIGVFKRDPATTPADEVTSEV